MKNGGRVLKLKIAALLMSIWVLNGAAFAWNDLGHRVVAQIAWNDLDRPTRTAIIRALRTAPNDSDMLRLLPSNPENWPANSDNQIYADLFQFIGTWPDHVRPGKRRKVTDKYHQGDWHYINLFWDGSNGTQVSLPPKGQLLLRIQAFSQSGSQENAAIQVAWLVHLIGDVHQPLHCSARITEDPIERDGDRGGNEFCLAVGCRENSRKMQLHSYWDSTLTRNYDRMVGETEEGLARRLALRISGRYPKGSLGNLSDGSEKWAEEGVRKSISTVYPETLQRNRTPSTAYRKTTLDASEPAIARAGYRLAKVLRDKFDH